MITNHKTRNRFFLALLPLTLVLGSCRDVVFSEYKKFKDYEWHAKDKASFNLEIKDTETFNNIYLMIRHTDAYPYNNIFLFVTTKYPDGKVLTDTMEVIMANKKGEWLGSGAGDIFDFKVPVKKNIRFPLRGNYEFTFEQAMRTDPLPMVMDFGFEIEKSK